MERKYTNQDVLDDERLTALAHKYLMEYTGTFSVVLDFKAVLEDGGYLTTTHIRTVLNCMLADNRVQNMPKPVAPPPFDAGKHFARAMLGVPRQTFEARRPAFIELKANWKRPFLVSSSPRACRIHSIDKVKSKITYRPLAPVNKKWQVAVRPICSSHMSQANLRMLTEAEATSLLGTYNQYMEVFAWCKTCVFMERFEEDSDGES